MNDFAARTHRRLSSVLALSWIVAGFVSPALAQTGVSDDRVSLPDGPGSIEGIGDNVSVDGNMGAMSYSVPIEVPDGFGGLKPELSISYSSGGGNGVVGIGWDFEVPCIDRLTQRGLPTYTAEDELAANRSEQLVRVSRAGSTAVYRSRFERGFVRYTWHDVGPAGYMTAEYPDGRVGYFGADAEGRIVPEARVQSATGETFRYLLVEVVDVFDHRLRYEYALSGNEPLLRRIGWVYRGGVDPRYSVELTYEGRPDPISDADPGFEELLTERLAGAAVLSGATVIRRYALTYEDDAASGGLSRLASVERFGRDGSRYPVVHSFGYSQALGGVCEGTCERPFVVEMGTLSGAVGLRSGDATLIDINGDALPDLLDTTHRGPHVFYLNQLDGPGRGRFEAGYDSATGRQSAFRVGDPNVQVLDIDGDGFADLIHSLRGDALCNRGEGDWVTCPGADLGLALELDPEDSADPDPRGTRFVDIDGDRRIDVLRTPGATVTQGYLNTLSGFEPFVVEPIGRVFDGDAMQLADMNGDGLLDPVVIDADRAVRFRLSFGRGRWGAWVTAIGPSIAASDADRVELQDLNGDGLDDLVIVNALGVRFAINRNAGRFDALRAIDAADVDGAIPSYDPDRTTILYADMNGNGTQDVVWVQQTGQVSYLELFPVRPNLLSRVENGIGMVHEVIYGTSVAHQARAEEAWAYHLPHAMNIVDRTDTWVTLTGGDDGAGLHEEVVYGYRDGFYDGVEKQFRGFARVEMRTLAETSRDSQEPALTVSEFDVGAEDPYRASLLRRRQVFAGEEERPLSEERTVYGDCDVAGAPPSGLLFDVRHICPIEQTTLRQEGAEVSAWATVRTETRYDGYGQVTWQANLGVAHMGAPESSSACGACDREASAFGAACGDECVGDESHEETEYIEPGPDTGGRWILGRAHTVRRYGVSGGPSTEEHTYYDGAPFEGMALGRLNEGLVSRTTRAVDAAGATVESVRNAHDADGNVVQTLDPLGSPDDETGHRRAFSYDAEGQRVIRTEIFLSTPEGEPYRLEQHYVYEPDFDKVVEGSGWMIAGGESARNSTFYEYDAFGRLSSIVKPGDTLAMPTMRVSYELGDPVSRIVIHRRSEVGGAEDLEQVRCIDGRGRTVQERTRVGEDRWRVNGFTEFNRRGAPVRIYQPYEGSTGFCETAPPSGVLFTEIAYDAARREIRRVAPDGELYAAASETRVVHEPLATFTYDAEDSDPASPHFDTPDVVRVDGQGRTVAIERSLRPDGGALETAVTTIRYDSLGRMRGYVDAAGNEKVQEYDLAGRLLRVDDPNSGVSEFEHDAAGNVLATRDARGVIVRTEYDGANRPTLRFDDEDPEATAIRSRYDFAPDCAACENGEGQLVETTYPLPTELTAILGGARLGVDHRGYDARGRAVYEARTLGDAHLAIEHVFDDADREVATIYPGDQRIERRFDDASRLVAIADLVEQIRYDERALLTGISRADGTEDERVHDPLMRLSALRTYGVDGAALQDFGYTRERTGEILEITDGSELPAGFPSAAATYRYDAWHRLVGAEQAAGETETLAWSYDSIDNIASATSSLEAASLAHVGDYAYSRAGVASAAGATALSHDDAGYLLQRGELALAWDFLGRMTEASRDGETRARYVYGPDHRRIATLEEGGLTLYLGRDYEVRDGVGRAYARVGRDRVTRTQSAAIGTELLTDHLGDGSIDAGDAWLGRDGPDASALLRAAARGLLHEAAPEPTQLHHDHLGSITLATREGEIAGQRRYHPYGALRAERGFLDERGFTGQELDAATGLLHFEYRYLDPITGRWASADPLFASVSSVEKVNEAVSRFGYVGAAAMNLVDPTGLGKKTRAAAAKVARGTAFVVETATDIGQNPIGGPGTLAGKILNKTADLLDSSQATAATPQPLDARNAAQHAAHNRLVGIPAVRSENAALRGEVASLTARVAGLEAAVRNKPGDATLRATDAVVTGVSTALRGLSATAASASGALRDVGNAAEQFVRQIHPDPNS